MKAIPAVLLVLSLGVTSVSSAVRAQEPGVFEVVVPAAQLNEPVGFIDPEIKTIGQFLGGLTAYADGTPCVQTSTTTGGDAVLRVGAAGQPAPCMVEGAIVTFVDGFCRQLASQAVLRKGTSVTLTNLAPVPPGSGLDCVPSTPSPAASSTAAPPQVQPIASSTPLPQSPPGGITPPSTGEAGLLAR